MQASDKKTIHAVMSVLTIVVGLVLMTGKIWFDSEPGLVPLAMVALGAGWYFTLDGGGQRMGSERFG